MEEQLRDILRDVAGLDKPVETLRDEDDLFTAGLSSFATVNVMLAVEERFDLEFPDRLLSRASFRSIAALAGVVRELQGEHSRA